MDQDNFCYRGDDCQQANQGQQIVGKDNDAKGFNDQSKNAQASLGAQPTETPTNEPTIPVTPPVGTCSTCFTTAFASLTPLQLNVVVALLRGGTSGIAGHCNLPSFSAVLCI
jgi:hypothetical protein